MGMFSDLMGKIFAHAPTSAPTQQTAAAPQAAPAGAPPTSVPAAGPEIEAPAPVDIPAATDGSAAPPTDAGMVSAASVPAASSAPVDVAAILDGLAVKNPEKLDWKRSIVDMLKLLGMDSSLSARKELAKDLQYSGDESDSAAMNVWLHKAVLQKLADNGGKVPAELLG